MNSSVRNFIEEFVRGGPMVGQNNPVKDDKELRRNLSEKQLDKMVSDSFPASDPPSTY